MNNVYTSIEDKIISGEYRAGEQITEMRLSGELGVSRTPVREALAMLEKDGLVELIPNKGAVVRGISQSDLLDIYSIRKRLEGLAAAMAAARIGDKGINELEEIMELSDFYLSKNNTEKLEELDSRFHTCIYNACESRMLAKILSDLHRVIGAYRRRSLDNPDRVGKSVAEHREIFEAIASKDAARAEELMSAHIDAALTNLLSLEK